MVSQIHLNDRKKEIDSAAKDDLPYVNSRPKKIIETHLLKCIHTYGFQMFGLVTNGSRKVVLGYIDLSSLHFSHR